LIFLEHLHAQSIFNDPKWAQIDAINKTRTFNRTVKDYNAMVTQFGVGFCLFGWGYSTILKKTSGAIVKLGWGSTVVGALFMVLAPTYVMADELTFDEHDFYNIVDLHERLYAASQAKENPILKRDVLQKILILSKQHKLPEKDIDVLKKELRSVEAEVRDLHDQALDQKNPSAIEIFIESQNIYQQIEQDGIREKIVEELKKGG